MKIIKFMLASSGNENERDSLELGAFFSDMNDRYILYDVYFKLITNTDITEGTIIPEVNDSDWFYVLFGCNADSRIIDYFNAAHDAFQKNKRPKITTYFKKIETGEPEKSVRSFMERLDGEFGHYYNFYANVDTIKLNIALQLKSLGIESPPTDVVSGGKLIVLDNIPLLSNNRQLAKLKKEYADIDGKFIAASEMVRDNPDDTEAGLLCLQLSGRRNEIGEEIRKVQQNIISMEQNFLQSAGMNGLSNRQKQARRYLENGEFEKAKDALSAEDLRRDADLLNGGDLRIRINDWLMRAEVLQCDYANEDRFDEIDQAFEEAVNLERKGNLERNAEFLYAEYLYRQKRYADAAVHADFCLKYHALVNSGGNEPCKVLELMGDALLGLNRFSEAEPYYIKALAVRETEGNELALIDAYVRIGNLYDMRIKGADSLIDHYDGLAEWYNKAYDLIELAVKRNTGLAGPLASEQAVLYYKLVRGFGTEEQYGEIDALIETALNYIGNDPAQRETLSLLHQIKGEITAPNSYDEALLSYLRSIEIMEQLAIENPARYEGQLADLYIGLAAVNSEDDWSLMFSMDRESKECSFERAKERAGWLFRAKDILERLERTNQELYAPKLANVCTDLAIRLEESGDSGKAEGIYRRAADILTVLAEKEPNMYAMKANDACKGLTVIYTENNRYDEVEAITTQMTEIWEKYSNKFPDNNIAALETRIAIENLANFHCKRNQFEKAEPQLRRLLRIYDDCDIEQAPDTVKKNRGAEIEALFAIILKVHKGNGFARKTERLLRDVRELLEDYSEILPEYFEHSLAFVRKELELLAEESVK